MEHKGGPTVILAKTVKGYGLGSAQARNATHSEKKLADDGLAAFVKRFDIPVPEQAAKDGAFYRPEPDAPETAVHAGRGARSWAGICRSARCRRWRSARRSSRRRRWSSSRRGRRARRARSISTTMGFVNLLNALMKDKAIGKWIVPIVPDEGRTFGLESSIKQVGIYAPEGQKYVPHDADMLLSYRENKDGQILEEGITEAGSMASFTAAGTAYSNYGVPSIPFYMYYSMFGFQRIGDMAWAFADSQRQGLPDGRHGRAHDHAGRRAAAPGWALDCAFEHRADVRDVRSGVRV